MKKMLFSVLLVSILFSACTTPPPATAEPTAARKVWTYQDMVVGFLSVGSESYWRTAFNISFKETAEKLGIRLMFMEPEARRIDQRLAFSQFFANKDVNVIILPPFEPTGWEDVLRQARDAGKIVIIVDRTVDAPEDLYTTYVGNDFGEEGRKAGREMCRLLAGVAGKKVWELAGTVGSSAAIDRGQGFRETMGQCGIDLVASRAADFDTAKSQEVTAAWLRANRDVQGIYAQNDDMALGAIAALKEAGLRPGVNVKIVSIDGTSGAFKAMLAGELNVTVECNPLLAPQVYEAALKALNGKSLPKWIPANEGVFRADDPNLQEIAAGREY